MTRIRSGHVRTTVHNQFRHTVSVGHGGPFGVDQVCGPFSSKAGKTPSCSSRDRGIGFVRVIALKLRMILKASPRLPFVRDPLRAHVVELARSALLKLVFL